MQRVLTVLFILMVPLALYPEDRGGASAQADLREFRASSNSGNDSRHSIHPALEAIRYAFYPPRKEKALYLRLVADSLSRAELVFAGTGDEPLRLRLPASDAECVVMIPLTGKPALSALVLPPGMGFFFAPPSHDLLGMIHPDRPDELVLALPEAPVPYGASSAAIASADAETDDAETDDTETEGDQTGASDSAAAGPAESGKAVEGAGEGTSPETEPDRPVDGTPEEDLVLTLNNPGAVRIAGGSDYDAVLRSHDSTRVFHFPFSPGDRWVVSPLSALDLLSFRREERPDFPVPLTREGMQILENDSSDWRSDDFEIYRWASLPEVLIFDCLDYDIQNRFFRRLAFFVEKKGYRGQILSNEELRGRHAWNAHDYRASDLAAFFNKAEELDALLYDEEILLREILIEEGILIRDGEILKEGTGAINSMALESGFGLRYRFFTHEASHGIYFTQQIYRDFVKGFWESLEEEERELWRRYMSWNAYDPEDEDLMMNEFQAYFTQQPVSDAAAYFMIRMRRVAEGTPGFGELFYQMEDSLPGRFRRWAEGVEAFQKENWGLEAGNFSPLQAEWPLKNE